MNSERSGGKGVTEDLLHALDMGMGQVSATLRSLQRHMPVSDDPQQFLFVGGPFDTAHDLSGQQAKAGLGRLDHFRFCPRQHRGQRWRNKTGWRDQSHRQQLADDGRDLIGGQQAAQSGAGLAAIQQDQDGALPAVQAQAALRDLGPAFFRLGIYVGGHG
jgi:hypothetical protein